VDIAAWLHSLGMQQYEAAFRDNAIDARVLPNPTAEDHKDLGVGLVGHRRRLLDAIAALGAKTPTSSPDAPVRAGAESRSPFPHPPRKRAPPRSAWQRHQKGALAGALFPDG